MSPGVRVRSTPGSRPARDRSGWWRGARAAVGLLALVVLAGCGLFGGDDDPSGSNPSGPEPAPTVRVTGPVTVGGADYTEMRIMQALYTRLLEKAGFEVERKPFPNRADHLAALESGQVDLVPEYAATFAEYLNREENGRDVRQVGVPDVAATVKALRELAGKRDLSVFQPAAAANQNGFAVDADFARKEKVTTLSALAARGEPVVLVGTKECDSRPFCAAGLRRAYGMQVKNVLPLGVGTYEGKKAVTDGEADVVLVATTDGTLGAMGLELLADDKKLQPADNLVPIAGARLAADPRAAAALEPLAGVLTTEDLATLNEQVDSERRSPEGVAKAYLTSKNLL